MKVAVWSALGRVGAYSTGVGKHVLNMSCGLAAKSGWDVSLVLTSDLASNTCPGATRMEGIPHIRLPFGRRTAEVLWRTLRRPRLDRWLPDVNWVYCPRELYVPVGSARYAVTVHDLYRLEPEFQQHDFRSSYRWRRLLQRGLSEADLVLSVSEFTKRRLVELAGLDPRKIRVVGNGVEDFFFKIGDRGSVTPPRSSEQPYVLSVGGITRKKGASNLLAAASELARAAPGVILVVTGPIEPEFASQTRAAPNIRLMPRGFPDSDMYRLVQGASAVLILSEYEGFGIPALEAMAAGIPVVAADRAALPEVVGRAGMLVDPGNSEEVVENLVKLIADEDARKDMIDKGRERAELYRWEQCVERLCAAFEEFSGAKVSTNHGSRRRQQPDPVFVDSRDA